MNSTEFNKLLDAIIADHSTADLTEAAGGIRTEQVQSDKVGYDWLIYYVNDVAVRKDYVEQEIPYGTADHPIVWKEGMSLIQNAYYTHDGVTKVWFGDADAVAAWDDENFVEM
jgi:hypothetical protein